ncbi:MAG: Carboxylesterase [Parcubacteria group bacterium GW2011_GWA2_38_13]|nr:MAG: Carboxylesterase [Parcubacteria group bacterium GW2011_GWA2_38_13]
MPQIPLDGLNIIKNEPEKPLKKYMKGAEPFFHNANSDIGILLLHGFTASPYQFKELREKLAQKNITTYAPVIAGHGTTPEDLMATTIGDWIESAQNAYNFLKEKSKFIVIIGSSFGGNLAYHLAVKNDDALKGIVSLGTPVYLRWHRIIIARTIVYGWMKKFYKKQSANYKPSYTDAPEVVSYPVIPISSLKNLLNFLKYFTLPGLKNITTPTLIIQANQDPVVNPKSAQHLHQYLGSQHKKVYWMEGNFHALDEPSKKQEIFDVIYTFIDEVTKKNGNNNL